MYAVRGGRATRRRNVNDPFGRFQGRRIAGAVAMVPNQMLARTVARNMGLAVTRNRAPRAAIKGAIANYGGRTELKYVDIALTAYPCDTTGTVTALNLLAVGDDNTTRDGRQVTIKSVQLKGIIKNVDATSGPTLARVLLVWDNASNSGAIATIAQILSAASSVSFPLIDNANRFTILWDHTYGVGGIDTTATQSYSAAIPEAINYYKRINQLTQYSGTTAAIGSIQNGALLMVTVGDQAVNGGATFNCATRVRFTDN